MREKSPGSRAVFILAGFLALGFVRNARAFVDPRQESARAFGMGNAFSAVGNDLNSIFFNPAGLDNVKQIELSATAGRNLPAQGDPQSDVHFAGALPLKEYKTKWNFGTAGFLAHRAARRDDGSVTNLGASWGGNLTEIVPKNLIPFPFPGELKTGVSLNIRQITSGGPSSHSEGLGAGIGLGFLYKIKDGGALWNQGWNVALAIQEVNMKSVSSPVLYRLGAARKLDRYTFAMDMTVEEGVTKFFPGAEASLLRNLLIARLGTGYAPGQPRQVTVGIGTILPPFQIDVAYGFPLGDPHKRNDRILFSLTYRFGAPLLSQFIEGDGPGEMGRLENQIANLKAERKTLESALKEERKLYEKMASDLNQTQIRIDESNREFQAAGADLARKKNEVGLIEKSILELQAEKAALQKTFDARRTDLKNLEIRPPGGAGGPRVHKVAPGETLRDVAKKYYGDASLWKTIYDANPDKMKRGAPKAGTELLIP